MRNNRLNTRKEELHRINENIRTREVRLVGENIEQGVYSIQEALRFADNLELDLVEISPLAEPPVCKIMDYQKFLYQQKKKQKEAKAKSVKVVVKEIRFGPQTDDHDFNFKLKHARGFLEEGSKVKAYVFFKGRSILFKEQGELLLLRFATELEDLGKAEQLPALEGKKMIMMLSPKKGQAQATKPIPVKPKVLKKEGSTTEPTEIVETPDVEAIVSPEVNNNEEINNEA